MDLALPESERTYLRELAARQAEIAALPVMAARKQQWFDLNDGRVGARPPVIVETWTFDRDFMPEGIFRCTSELGRGIEHQLLRNIRNHELIDDDKVIPDTFDYGWSVTIDELGVRIPQRAVKDAQGYETGYEFQHPIKDLRRSGAAHARRLSGRSRRTWARQAFLDDLLGDALPVVIRLRGASAIRC